MILSTILRPPGAPPEEKRERTLGRARRPLPAARERGRRYNRALAVGVIASVLLHVLVVRLSPLFIRYLEPGIFIFAPRQPVAAREEGMRIVDLVVSETPAAEPPPVDVPEPVDEPAPEPEAGTAPALSAAERLRPRVGDWRLWVIPPTLPRADRTPDERAEELRQRLLARLEAYEDSLAAELARESERLNWTLGEEGKEWGITPGKIHLGGITLPLPLYFGPHPAQSRLDEARSAEWQAIQRQAAQGAIDESFEDRVRAIRERKEREEAEKKAEQDTTGTGGGSPPPS